MDKWCTFGYLNKNCPEHIGKLVERKGNAGWIQYAEKQQYPLECWDMNYVVIHDTIEDAIKCLLKHKSDWGIIDIQESLAFNVDVDWDKLNSDNGS